MFGGRVGIKAKGESGEGAGVQGRLISAAGLLRVAVWELLTGPPRSEAEELKAGHKTHNSI